MKPTPPPNIVCPEGGKPRPRQEDPLDVLERECWDLRCRNVPTGGDDYDVEWFVIEHYMAEPHEREVASGRSPSEAIRNALALPAEAS